MNANSKSRQFILDRLWTAYDNVDMRRRRSFYFLLTSTTLFGVLWLSQPPEFNLPLFNNKVSLYAAMAIAPAFLLVFLPSYFYLCCHTICNLARWLEYFRQEYSDEIADLGLTYVELHASIKNRDITEGMNIYLMFTGSSPSYDLPLPLIARLVKGYLANFIRFLTFLVPPMLYIVITIWIWDHPPDQLSNTVSYVLVGFYALMFPSFPFALFYFYRRARPFLKVMTQNVEAN